jgi:flagellar biosynthetic protein FlhB
MLRTCVEMVRFYFLRVTELDPVKDRIIVLVFFRYLARLALPILAVAVVSALFSNIVQVGLLFTTKPITPDFTRVLPKVGQFFTRIFSIDGLFNFGKSLAKMLIIGGVSFALIYSEKDKLLNLQKAGLWTGLTAVSSLAIRMLLISALLMLIVSIVDYFFQRWRFRKRHQMSREEKKEEFKMHEADPMIQSRIRSRFRELLKQNLAVMVPRADVVITNPTHLAVALQYDQRSMDGPMVIAMGEDEIASRIRKIAEDNEVPLVEDKPLARTLYSETKVGDIIPMKYWNAVALVLSKVWRLNEDRRRKKSA